MRALRRVDQLRKDHVRLREHLTYLQHTLASGTDPGLLQLACRAFYTELRRHLQREARCASLCARRLGRCGSDELRWLALEHHEQLEQFQAVRAAFRTNGHALNGVASGMAANVLGRFERCCEEQEAELFPFLEHAFNGAARPHAASRPRELAAVL